MPNERSSFSVFGKILDFLYPPKCAACGTVGYDGLCPRCQGHLDSLFSPKSYLASGGNGFADGMISLFPYEDEAVQTLLFDWKREDYPDLHKIFSVYLEKTVKKGALPAPIHRITYLPRRQIARKKAGFDQAEAITKELARILNLPAETLLRRRGYSKPQRRAKYEHRAKNVRGVFVPTAELNGETVLLIDDIVTTGSSAREGARILKKAGAMKVYILSLAH